MPSDGLRVMQALKLHITEVKQCTCSQTRGKNSILLSIYQHRREDQEERGQIMKALQKGLPLKLKSLLYLKMCKLQIQKGELL